MRAHFERGQALFDWGRYRESIAEYRQELSGAPGCVASHTNIAAAFLNLGQPLEATQAIREALGIDPEYAHAHYLRSVILRNAKNYSGAREAICEAIRLTPSAEYYAELARIHHADLRFYDVLSATAAALAIDPRHVPSILLRGEALIKQGEINEGIQLYRAAIAADPQNPAAHHALGAQTLQAGDASTALGLLREARRLDPVAQNDVSSIALALGRLLPLFCTFDRLIFRGHLRSPKIRWLLLVLLGSMMLFRVRVIGDKDSLFEAVHPLWIAFCLFGANFLVLPFTFDMAARSAGKMAAHGEFGLRKYQAVLQSLVLAPVLCLHAAATLTAVVASISPIIAGVACYVGLSLPYMMTVVKTCRNQIGFYLGILMTVIMSLGAVFASLAALPSFRLDDTAISLVALAVVLPATYFADDFERWAIGARISRR